MSAQLARLARCEGPAAWGERAAKAWTGEVGFGARRRRRRGLAQTGSTTQGQTPRGTGSRQRPTARDADKDSSTCTAARRTARHSTARTAAARRLFGERSRRATPRRPQGSSLRPENGTQAPGLRRATHRQCARIQARLSRAHQFLAKLRPKPRKLSAALGWTGLGILSAHTTSGSLAFTS